ncbi:MAG TPA: hypothetical protein VGS10_16290 [Terracidiphilus sp.]|nr:hypothetical protein [Terracidiphilus sp.]
MFRRSADCLLGAMLVAALLPLVFLSALDHYIRFEWPMRARRQNPVSANTPPANPAAIEFEFEHAIEAYEALIDAVLTERRA